MMTPDIQERFKNIKGILWDLDGTLYRFEDDFTEHFHHETARLAAESGVDLPMENLISMSRESFRLHGYSGKIFVEKYAVERQFLHFEMGRRADISIINPMVNLSGLMNMPGLTHALITHGSKEYALRVIKHLTLEIWFPPSRVQGFEDFQFQSKSDSRAAFECALTHIESDAAEAVMVEDTVRNLRIPHEMGITTVWLTHGEPVADAPRYVDLVCRDAVDLLGLIKEARAL